ncbi:MAG: hypothetical protein PF630_04955 [Gammaproteobacteria bacterium]|nr:hypothetical protein [Gammaproteobacteria bacterium]
MSKFGVNYHFRNDDSWASVLFSGKYPQLYTGVNGKNDALPAMAQAATVTVEESGQSSENSNTLQVDLWLPEDLLSQIDQDQIKDDIRTDLLLFRHLFPRYNSGINLTLSLVPVGIRHSATSPMRVTNGHMSLEMVYGLANNSCLTTTTTKNVKTCSMTLLEAMSIFLHEFAHYYTHKLVPETHVGTNSKGNKHKKTADQLSASIVNMCIQSNRDIGTYRSPFNIDPDRTGIRAGEAKAMSGSQLLRLKQFFYPSGLDTVNKRMYLIASYIFFVLADKWGAPVQFEMASEQSSSRTIFTLNEGVRSDLCQYASEILELPHNIDLQWSTLVNLVNEKTPPHPQ